MIRSTLTILERRTLSARKLSALGESGTDDCPAWVDSVGGLSGLAGFVFTIPVNPPRGSPRNNHAAGQGLHSAAR
jgi:hypothetical protein